jgi:Ca-activated chloride channel family protein
MDCVGRAPAGCAPREVEQSIAPVANNAFVDHGTNPVHKVADERLSTFAIDVDTASYTYGRRSLREGQLPPRESVRVEEWVNYFGYDYPAPKGSDPFAVALEAAPSPFAKGKHLLRIGIQGKKVENAARKPARLTFLVDTSGSMQGPDRLGLVQQSLRMLVDNLNPTDSVAICTYAGSVREVLAPTGIEDKAKIHEAIAALTAGGGTAMGSGLELAYKLASANFIDGGVNRIIVCSDGDANVGRTSQQEIQATIKSYVEKGITLSTTGFGTGNYKDALMEALADKGNGNYSYIDSLQQAKRVFVEQLAGTLEVIAKDVKVQVEFDPKSVASYRLVGYENRKLENQDFRNDKVDAGEIGAGHRVTALYELTLADAPSGPLATVRVRHKAPDAKAEDAAKESAFAIATGELEDRAQDGSADFRFAAAVAGFAEILRGSPEAKSWTIAQVVEIASGSATSSEREELIALATRTADLIARAR